VSGPGLDRAEARRRTPADVLAGAEGDGRVRVAEAYRRLALLDEVGACLDGSSPGAGDALAAFQAERFDALTALPDGPDADRAAAAILADSSDRWGDYLRLIDPDAAPAVDPEREPEAESDPGPMGEVDTGALLRLILGGAAPPADPPAPPAAAPEPAVSTAPAAARPAAVVPSLFGPLPAAVTVATPRPAAAEPQIDPELRDVFLAEASELFERIEGLVLGLEPGRPAGDGLGEVGRCCHTLKGAAGSVGLARLAATVHEAEDRLNAAAGVTSADLIDTLHAFLRDLDAAFDALRRGGPPGCDAGDRVATPAESPPTASSRPVPTAPECPPPADPPPGPVGEAPAGEGPVRVAAERLDELMDLASELLSRRSQWGAQAEGLKAFATQARTCRHRFAATLDRLTDLDRAASDAPAERQELARRLAEQSEDLALLAESAGAAAEPLADNGEALARLTLRLWEALQSVRVVPVRGLFQRLARVAIDAGRVEGRRVEVRTTGEETGVDRGVLDKAFEPLLHLVRNAVGHGIEPPEDRVKAGKPPAGRVTLGAARVGGALVLTVADDGRGLDLEAIAAKGRRLGLIGPEESPPPERLRALIFRPGFSTREATNANSGRGVGMDVVGQEVARLHGSITMESEAGRGTRMRVTLPARLALEQAVLLRVGGRAYALPVAAVELARPWEDGDGAADPAGPGGGPTAAMRGGRVPLVDAREALAGAGGAGPAVSCPTLLLVRAGGEALALRVDAVEGAHELVVKPLGPLLAGHPLVTGASLSAAGEVILALDPGGLARLAGAAVRNPAAPAGRADRPRAARVLVVDDSVSVRAVVVRQLRGLGLEVDEASDGLEALGRLRAGAYGLVLTDLEMPRMDGFELLAELNRLGVSPATPVILASTRADPETRRRAEALGARDYLCKPIEPAVLASRLGGLLGCRPAPALQGS